MPTIMHIVFVVAILGILLIMRDAWTNMVRDYFQTRPAFANDPWWVRLDHWIYHQETCRVENLVCEQNIWVGGRIKRVGRPITFIR